MRTFWAFVFFSLATTALANNCPIGRKDDHLNIHQVMINFGHFTLSADMIAVKGINPAENIQNEDLQKAADDLSVASECADAVISGYEANPDLLPDKASFLTGDARMEYISDFIYFMTDFKDEIANYRQAFLDILAQPNEQRDWQGLYQKSKDFDDYVSHAHSKLSTRLERL